jgi:hypothetical protein
VTTPVAFRFAMIPMEGVALTLACIVASIVALTVERNVEFGMAMHVGFEFPGPVSDIFAF